MVKEQKENNMVADVINYNVDDYGVLRVYKGNAILLESEDWLSTPQEEIEKFIDENLEEMGIKDGQQIEALRRFVQG